MTEVGTAEAFARAGNQLLRSARAHKRTAGFHRQQARELMAELELLCLTCKDLGIEIDIEMPIHKHQDP